MSEHEQYIRRSIELARQARKDGNHPFGALLYDPHTGEVVVEALNSVHTDNDVTRHAELNAISECSKKCTAEQRARLILYTSTEPESQCAMCAGALYWCGVRKVVYGCPEEVLSAIVTEAFGEDTDLHAQSRAVLGNAAQEVQIIGPVLDEEAAEVHRGYWGVEV